jgi:hypothetical protein
LKAFLYSVMSATNPNNVNLLHLITLTWSTSRRLLQCTLSATEQATADIWLRQQNFYTRVSSDSSASTKLNYCGRVCALIRFTFTSRKLLLQSSGRFYGKGGGGGFKRKSETAFSFLIP